MTKLDGLVADSLSRNEGYKYPLTMPKICPKTVAARFTSIDISMFRGHDVMASCHEAVPSGSRSGTSARPTLPQRGRSKRIKVIYARMQDAIPYSA